MTTRQSFLAVAWCSDKAGHRHLWPLMAFSSWLIQGWQRWWPEVTTLRLHLFEKNQWKLPSQPRLRCTIPRQACNSCQFAELLQYASPESFPVRDVSANLFFPSDLTPSALCRHGLLAYHASEPGRECERKCESPYMQGSNIWTAPSRLPGCFKKPDGKHRAPWSKTSLSRTCNKGRWPEPLEH